MKRKKTGEKLTRFHIIAKENGGKTNENNVSFVSRDKHRAYHFLFGTKNPSEVVKELVENYWNDQWNHVQRALEEVL